MFVLGVIALWIVAICGVFGQGPIGDACHSIVEKDGKCVEQFEFFKALGYSVGVFVAAPFVLHYVLELIKVLWRLVRHIFDKIIVPLWNSIVLSFLVTVAPQILKFLYERITKVIDVLADKVEPFCETVIGSIASCFMTVALVLKGIVWVPTCLCQRIGAWLDKKADAGCCTAK